MSHSRRSASRPCTYRRSPCRSGRHSKGASVRRCKPCCKRRSSRKWDRSSRSCRCSSCPSFPCSSRRRGAYLPRKHSTGGTRSRCRSASRLCMCRRCESPSRRRSKRANHPRTYTRILPCPGWSRCNRGGRPRRRVIQFRARRHPKASPWRRSLRRRGCRTLAPGMSRSRQRGARAVRWTRTKRSGLSRLEVWAAQAASATATCRPIAPRVCAICMATGKDGGAITVLNKEAMDE